MVGGGCRANHQPHHGVQPEREEVWLLCLMRGGPRPNERCDIWQANDVRPDVEGLVVQLEERNKEAGGTIGTVSPRDVPERAIGRHRLVADKGDGEGRLRAPSLCSR
eukprot:scaffold32475_cov27-Tisochrysis_lutea.AAC.4